MISTVIVQYNHPELTRQTVDSLRSHNPGEPEIVVVDNGSPDPGTRAASEQFTGCRVIFNPTNAGYGAANNLGARESHGDIILFLNNDTIVHSDILPRIESYFEETPSCGAAGLQLLNRDGTEQNSTGETLTIWSIWHTRRRKYVYRAPDTVRRDWVTGAALAVRRSVFDEVGGFDKRYFMYFEDVDLCERIRRAGHEIHLIPSVRVEHLRGGSQDGGMPFQVQKEFRRSQVLCYSQHSSFVDNVLLRVYLFARFLPHRIMGNRDQRDLASFVHSILFRSPGERGH